MSFKRVYLGTQRLTWVPILGFEPAWPLLLLANNGQHCKDPELTRGSLKIPRMNVIYLEPGPGCLRDSDFPDRSYPLDTLDTNSLSSCGHCSSNSALCPLALNTKVLPILSYRALSPMKFCLPFRSRILFCCCCCCLVFLRQGFAALELSWN